MFILLFLTLSAFLKFLFVLFGETKLVSVSIFLLFLEVPQPAEFVDSFPFYTMHRFKVLLFTMFSCKGHVF